MRLMNRERQYLRAVTTVLVRHRVAVNTGRTERIRISRVFACCLIEPGVHPQIRYVAVTDGLFVIVRLDTVAA